ncbi:unnamed protein product, partial [Iphiclides podalirius]
MEVDRILYIFGSFTRKKQDRRKSLEPSSISAGNSPLHAQKPSRPASQSHSLCVRTRMSGCTEGRKSRLKDWECALCKKELVEPRLLGCLHSFCTRCLQGLQREECDEWNELEDGSVQLDPGEPRSGSGTGSAGSGYESDARNSSSDGSLDLKPQKYGILIRKVDGDNVQFVVCPTCGHETQLPPGGIPDLPLNYVLLRKMCLADNDDIGILCDLCDSDNKAVSRCSQCLVSVCPSCGKAHGKQRSTSSHYLEPIEPPAKYCTQHPRSELSVYCATCQQVVCRECGVVSHGGHALASAARAAAERARLLRDACERAKLVPEHVGRVAGALDVHALQTDCCQAEAMRQPNTSAGQAPVDRQEQASAVEAEVRAWAEQYRRAVEAHVRALAGAAARARARHRQRNERAHRLLQQRAQHAHQAVRFAEEVGAAAPLLGALYPVVSFGVSGRLGGCDSFKDGKTRGYGGLIRVPASRADEGGGCNMGLIRYSFLTGVLTCSCHSPDSVVGNHQSRARETPSGNEREVLLQLLCEGREAELLSLSGPVLRRLQRLTELGALAEPPKLALRFAADARAGPASALCGRLLTQAPDPDKCLLHTEGLQDLHVDCEHEAIFELRDNNGERIWCGGEQVAGYFRRRDSSARPQSARVLDHNDGSYAVRFTPTAPGAYLLAVTLNNTPVKGSPFPCAARVFKSHSGQFHCCTFCSSGGRRDVTCGCGATMAGGYKGCGHGHAGWPGARHWSCCGSTRPHGHCANQPPTQRLYQFSL